LGMTGSAILTVVRSSRHTSLTTREARSAVEITDNSDDFDSVTQASLMYVDVMESYIHTPWQTGRHPQ